MLKDIKKKVTRRLRIVEGQVRGLQKMVADEKYCIDIITQSSAIRQALSVFEDLMLQNHLATHAREQMRDGQSKRAVSEILKAYKLAKKI